MEKLAVSMLLIGCFKLQQLQLADALVVGMHVFSFTSSSSSSFFIFLLQCLFFLYFQSSLVAVSEIK